MDTGSKDEELMEIDPSRRNIQLSATNDKVWGLGLRWLEFELSSGGKGEEKKMGGAKS